MISYTFPSLVLSTKGEIPCCSFKSLFATPATLEAHKEKFVVNKHNHILIEIYPYVICGNLAEHIALALTTNLTGYNSKRKWRFPYFSTHRITHLLIIAFGDARMAKDIFCWASRQQPVKYILVYCCWFEPKAVR